MGAQWFRLVVAEELGPRYREAFEGMAVQARDGATEITGPIRDAAHLQGVLERIAGFGLTLRSVTPLDAPPSGESPG
jgi:hypothetical protein